VNYYERHLGDYARDTAHLSLLEHGAYTILLDRFYATEQGIPTDQAHRIARAKSKDERAAVDAVLAEFFVLQGGAYIQKRALAEIQKAQTRINAARANGKTGGRPKRNPEETHRVSSGFNSGTQVKALQTPDSRLQAPDSSSYPSDTHSRSARDVSGETFDGWTYVEQSIRPVYPPGIYAAAQWLVACKHIERILEAGLDTPEGLIAKVADFRAQCDALERTGTQYVTSPVKHFDPVAGNWRGPFPLPAKPETPMERIHRLNSPSRVLDGEVVNG
jgi:uncharacterized protein YdaU (DUF1376 family)